MYRQGLQESGLPWGCDPAVSGGIVMDPTNDLGSKPQEVLGVLSPFLPSGMIVRIFLFLAVLSFPLGTILACRHLRLPTSSQIWIMITLLIPAWMFNKLIAFFYWGMVNFAIASYFAPYVLILFLNFLDRPDSKTYFCFCLTAALLFFFHILGSLAILPALFFYTLTARPLRWQWRITTALTPLLIIVLNAFWFIPFILARGMPPPPWSPIPVLDFTHHLTFSGWSEITGRLFPYNFIIFLCAIGLTLYGFNILRKFVGPRVIVSFALSSAFVLVLFFIGSFVPVTTDMQPKRFIIQAFPLMTLPMGIALSTLCKKARLPVSMSASALLLLVAAGAYYLQGKPGSLPLPPSPNLLSEFVTSHTESTDRLLIQSQDGYQYDGYEPRIFPLVFEREVIGCTFPEIYDPAQFLKKTLWGKELSKWSPDALLSSVKRWGISWVFTRTKEARKLFEKTISTPGKAVGKYHAFHVPGSHSRFLVGQGTISAKVNRLELTELLPKDGLIVLRYRYHPAWRTSMGLPVHQYPIPEDPTGFIALKNPSDNVTLYFDPYLMLRAPWPEDNFN
jgi:hypothetical protein